MVDPRGIVIRLSKSNLYKIVELLWNVWRNELNMLWEIITLWSREERAHDIILSRYNGRRFIVIRYRFAWIENLPSKTRFALENNRVCGIFFGHRAVPFFCFADIPRVWPASLQISLFFIYLFIIISLEIRSSDGPERGCIFRAAWGPKSPVVKNVVYLTKRYILTWK